MLKVPFTVPSKTSDDLDFVLSSINSGKISGDGPYTKKAQLLLQKQINKNGKVYVSMENKLLFNSGSWAVGENGKQAVRKLAKVLSDNPDISVLIEGHTDNDPFNGPVIKDNWDLSVKRATAIVRILEDANVSEKQITAAGRGEYVPVASNN